MNISASCCQMASLVREYCSLIDNGQRGGCEYFWLRRMEKLLPRLHAAVVSLDGKQIQMNYDFPNDDLRCELFMQLNERLFNDVFLWSDLDRDEVKRSMCESLADDFTDIYFDLKKGLDLLDKHRAAQAVDNWYSSFYSHWGQHLMDAESWLHAVETRNYNTNHAAAQFRTASLQPE